MKHWVFLRNKVSLLWWNWRISITKLLSYKAFSPKKLSLSFLFCGMDHFQLRLLPWNWCFSITKLLSYKVFSQKQMSYLSCFVDWIISNWDYGHGKCLGNGWVVYGKLFSSTLCNKMRSIQKPRDMWKQKLYGLNWKVGCDTLPLWWINRFFYKQGLFATLMYHDMGKT